MLDQNNRYKSPTWDKAGKKSAPQRSPKDPHSVLQNAEARPFEPNSVQKKNDIGGQ